MNAEMVIIKTINIDSQLSVSDAVFNRRVSEKKSNGVVRFTDGIQKPFWTVLT